MVKKTNKKEIASKQKSKVEKNYRIFRVDDSDKKRLFPKKITMTRIYAKDDEDAYAQLKDYVRIANKEYKYYVESWTPHVVIRNGKRYEYEDFCEELDAERKNEPWYKRAWDELSLTCWVWFVRRPKDAWYWCRDLIYLIKHKQQYSASWNIDRVMLETLKFNLPILKKYKHCLSWKMLEKAYMEKHPKVSAAEAKKYFETHFNGYEDDIEKRSVELEHEMLDKLLEDIYAYEYYLEGYQDVVLFNEKSDPMMLEIDKKLRKTLPLIKGSYDRYDWKKMRILVEKRWNSIWETVRMYGQEFND